MAVTLVVFALNGRKRTLRIVIGSINGF
jgi:hypothetical protein